MTAAVAVKISDSDLNQMKVEYAGNDALVHIEMAVKGSATFSMDRSLNMEALAGV